MTSAELLQQLIEKGTMLATFVNEQIVPLSIQQLNWKPDMKHWSVAECLDHLINSNKLYFPIIEKALHAVKMKPEFQDQGEEFQFTLTGNMMIKMVKPENRKKVQAPKQFLPTQPHYDSRIVREFIGHHEKVMFYLAESKGLNLSKIKVYSPVNRIFKFNSGDCYAMMIYHDERHIQQLTQVMQMSDYPAK